MVLISGFFFFSCRRRHTRWPRDWSSDVCSSDLSALQWGILLWLGLGASGIGYLGWNLGARRVNTGQLAAMNNMLIPAGILVNVLIWNRDADWLRVAAGGAIIGLAVWLARRPAAAGVRYNRAHEHRE